MFIGHTLQCSRTPWSVLAATQAKCIGICIVWAKAKPAICPSRTILHDVLNGKTASSGVFDFVGHGLYNIVHRSPAGGLGHKTIRLCTIYN